MKTTRAHNLILTSMWLVDSCQYEPNDEYVRLSVAKKQLQLAIKAINKRMKEMNTFLDDEKKK